MLKVLHVSTIKLMFPTCICALYTRHFHLLALENNVITKTHLNSLCHTELNELILFHLLLF